MQTSGTTYVNSTSALRSAQLGGVKVFRSVIAQTNAATRSHPIRNPLEICTPPIPLAFPIPNALIRFFANLWGGNMVRWVTDSEIYWREFDRLIDDIEDAGMFAIPSLGNDEWHLVANAVHAGLNESYYDSVVNASSWSRRYMSYFFYSSVLEVKNVESAQSKPFETAGTMSNISSRWSPATRPGGPSCSGN